MKSIRIVLAAIRKADETFNLIENGDKIALGISGGKDSMALLYCLSLYKKFSKCDFEIYPVNLDLGFDGFDPSGISSYCNKLGLNLHVEDSKEVYQILKIQQEKQKLNHLPCSICSRMKKAAINKVAKQLGCNKVAFAHHGDDAIETYFMNMIYGSRIATFAPKMHLAKADVCFIRPLILCRENEIIRLVKEENIPVFDSHCPADKFTSREEIKNLIKSINKQYPSSKEGFLTMLSNFKKEDTWGKEIQYQINKDGLYLKPLTTLKDEREIINIRYKVFEKEINVSHEDEFDDDDILENEFLIYLKDKPIGTIRYRELEDRTFKIERFAILKEYRNNGYGRATLSYLIEMIRRDYTPCTIIIHSMDYIKDFYISLGFKIEGEPFFEANIKHVLLKINL